jgi:hypothetical protein
MPRKFLAAKAGEGKRVVAKLPPDVAANLAAFIALTGIQAQHVITEALKVYLPK